MASIINASSSGSGGIVQTADASGVLQLQSNGTVVLTVNTSNQMALGASGSGSASGSNSVGKEVIYKPIDTLTAPYGTRMIDLFAYYPGYENSNPSATIFAGVDAATSTQNGYLAVQTINANVLSEAVRFNQYGTVVLKGGSVNGGGVGVCFPATQVASSDANTLDDYEEGSWTPSISGVTLSTATGQYVKVGNAVIFWGRIAYSSGTPGAASATIAGLPFSTNSNNRSPMGVSQANSINFGTSATMLVGFINGTSINLFGNANNVGYITMPATTWFGSGSFLEFGGSYTVY